jgi:hypothetical protein
VRKTQIAASIVFERGKESIKIAPEVWAEIILYLSQRGWQPSVPSRWFLASNLSVSDANAKGLAVAGQKVLDEASRDPLSIYPVAFDMGKLAELVCFLEGGVFLIVR